MDNEGIADGNHGGQPQKQHRHRRTQHRQRSVLFGAGIKAEIADRKPTGRSPAQKLDGRDRQHVAAVLLCAKQSAEYDQDEKGQDRRDQNGRYIHECPTRQHGLFRAVRRNAGSPRWQPRSDRNPPSGRDR